MPDVILREVIPCAEDNGATCTLNGEIVGLDFACLEKAIGKWIPSLFVAEHCGVFRIDGAVLIVGADGVFSFSRLVTEEVGHSLLADFLAAYST